MNRESWLAYPPSRSYIEESTCVSQPMIGISTDVLMVAGGKPACCSLPRRQPLRFGSLVSCTWVDGLHGLNETGYWI